MRVLRSNPTPTSYLSPKLNGRPVAFGRGIFAQHPLAEGELLAVWGGEVVGSRRFHRMAHEARQVSVQVEEDLYLVPAVEGPAEWFNHSCEPNAGLCGQIAIVALRPIHAGEEVCYDYAMSDGSPYDEFECHCGASVCRGRVTGNDWRRPELWHRYAGHFSPYLQRRITALRNGSDRSTLLVATDG